MWWSKYVGAGLAIVAMWLAVLFVGVYGLEFVEGSMTVNTAVMLAPFAMVGTIIVGIFGFRT